MKTETYNGWANYETWAVALWLDNDEGSSSFWSDRASELAEELKDSVSAVAKMTGHEPFTIHGRVALKLADELKDFHEENNPLPGAGVYTDLLNAALSEVDWMEIANHYADQVEIKETENA